ncbi:MAG: nuclear transport factor 2 family protein [Ilumatobacteraceae bacterium]|nr:MAG: nuclear transport factor 2 family protein [Actinomycetota bacterium]
MGDGAALSAERQVTNLLHRYAEAVDDGDFDAVGELFAGAGYHAADPGAPVLRGDEVAAVMRRMVQVHEGGSPRTKHVVSNVIFELDESGEVAHTRSYFTVLQATSGLPLQPIVTGRYLDTFRVAEGVWRFSDRSIVIEHVGDVSQHMATGTL